MRWLPACACAAALFAGPAWAAESLQASSDDGHWRVVAQGASVSVFHDGVRVKNLAAVPRDGRQAPSAVAAIHAAPARRSFVIAFETLAELWELSIDPQAAPIFDGLVHDYRQGEAIAEPGYLGVRRTRLEQPLRELALDDSGAYVLGRGAADAVGRRPLVLLQLDIRRAIGRFDVSGEPDLAAVQTVRREAGPVLRVADRLGGPTIWVDLRRAALIDGAAATR
jgi:hypothetical protein